MGILPIGQSSSREELSSFPTEYSITGSGEPYPLCGAYYTVGCLEGHNHHGISDLVGGIDKRGKGKGYFERRRNSCDRSVCPTCWGAWANREKDRASQRLKAFKMKGRRLKPIHVTVSVPFKDWTLSLGEMRKKVYRILKRVSMIGGMLIFHPKRTRWGEGWFFSPHFHIIGYGWITDVRRNYLETEYIVKNIGIRRTVEGTIYYQLSHCGISKEHHTVTWFGALSYNKLKVVYKEPEPSTCPMCGEKLRMVLWNSSEDPPDLPEVEGVGFYDEWEHWIYKPPRVITYMDDII